ncbi:GNAT family N-acetyltransferase [Allohahella sp. A8]|uniref:GNAT family N-acetyltransferase n=1 Tax=Allohahella sp. A8 TaxID=3141461 RepID=UPI003A80C5AE
MTYQVRSAQLEDSQAIVELFQRTSQPGKITLNFERSPCYFHSAHVSCEQPDVFVAEEDGSGRIVGVGNIGQRTLFVNGSPRSVRYAHDLRVEPNYRGGHVLFDLYRQIPESDYQAGWLQAVILADNEPYLKAVAKHRPGLPRFLPYGMIETSLVFGSRLARTPSAGLEIRRASVDDLPHMQNFWDTEGPKKQLFPSYQFAQLAESAPYFRALRPEDYWLALDGSELVGVIGTWDQKAFKQTLVMAYAHGLKTLRHLYNLQNQLRGGPRLPPPGGQLIYLTLHSMLVKGNDPAIFRLLLDSIHAGMGRRYDALVCALFEQDALRPVLSKYRREIIRSQHFLLAHSGDPRLSLSDQLTPYVDAARL